MKPTALTSIWTIAALYASSAVAAPIKHVISFEGKAFRQSAEAHPLIGAQMEVTVVWNPDGLIPLVNGPTPFADLHTLWPSTNAVASLRVSGTASHDGIYPATVNPSPNIGFRLNRGGGAIFPEYMIPPVEIPFAGEKLYIFPLVATLGREFFGSEAINRPAPFTSDQVRGWFPPIVGFYPAEHEFSDNGPFEQVRTFDAINTRGYAIAIPEPTAIALGCVAVASLAALRRRK